jgi:hypothetical protein
LNADLRDLALLARAWSARPLLGAAALAALAWLTVPTAAVTIPAADGASSLLWPLVPVLVATAVPAFLAGADGDLERTAALPQAQVRVLALCVVLVVTAAAAVPATLRFDAHVVTRNAALLTGVATAAVALLPIGASWVPVAGTPLVMWLLGTDVGTRQLRPWAVLLAPRQSVAAWVAAIVVLVLGSSAYVAKPWLTKGRQPRLSCRAPCRRTARSDPGTRRPRSRSARCGSWPR